MSFTILNLNPRLFCVLLPVELVGWFLPHSLNQLSSEQPVACLQSPWQRIQGIIHNPLWWS
jgi:hypothetical protein